MDLAAYEVPEGVPSPFDDNVKIVAIDLFHPPDYLTQLASGGGLLNLRANESTPYIVEITLNEKGKETGWCKTGNWRVHRSYKAFQQLNNALKELVGEIPGFPVSKMHLGGLFGKSYTQTDSANERRIELAKWIEKARKSVEMHAKARRYFQTFFSAVPIASAISKCDASQVRTLLSPNTGFYHSLDLVDGKGCTALHYCVSRAGRGNPGAFETLKAVLYLPANTKSDVAPANNLIEPLASLLSRQDHSGRAALQCALEEQVQENGIAEREQCLSLLIKCKADLDIKSSDGKNIFHLCSDSPYLIHCITDSLPRMVNVPDAAGLTVLDYVNKSAKLTTEQAEDIKTCLRVVGAQTGDELTEVDKIFHQQMAQYDEFLELARNGGDHREELEVLTQIGDMCLQSHLTTAAKYYNCALAVAAAHNISGEETEETYQKLSMVEERILLKYHRPCREGMDTSFRIEHIKSRRQKLDNIRNNVDFKISDSSSRDVLTWISEGFQAIFKEIADEAVKECKDAPPCSYAIMLVGDIGTRMATPQATYQYAIALSKGDFEALEFFRMVSELIEVKVISLMETDHNALRYRTMSPIEPGLRLDSTGGGVVPRGQGRYQPLLLISFSPLLPWLQEPEYYDCNPITASALLYPHAATGDKKLFQEYLSELSRVLDRQFDVGVMALRQERAIGIISSEVMDFKQKFNRDKNAERYFEAYQQLRFPIRLLGALSLYYGVKASNAWDQVDELGSKNIFTTESCQHLKNALTNIVGILIKLKGHKVADIRGVTGNIEKEDQKDQDVELENKTEEPEGEELADHGPKEEEEDGNRGMMRFDTMSSSRKSDDTITGYEQLDDDVPPVKSSASEMNTSSEIKSSQGAPKKKAEVKIPVLTESDVEKIVEAYKSVLPFYEASRTFSFKNENPYAGKKLWDGSHINLAEIYFRLCHYSAAKKEFEMAVKENPEDSTLLNTIGMMHNKLGEYEKASEYYEKAVGVIEKTKGEDHKDLATPFNNLAMACIHLKQQRKAIGWLEKALKVDEKVYGKCHPHVAQDYHYLGMMWKSEGDFDQAIAYLEQAMEIDTERKGKVSHEVANDHHDLGKVYMDMQEYAKAIEHFEIALDIELSLRSTHHPAIAVRLNALATVHTSIANYEIAAGFYERAMEVDKAIHGEDHISYATDLHNLGVVCYHMDSLERSLPHLQKSLAIHEKLLGPDHEDTVAVRNMVKRVEIQLAKKGQMSPEEYEAWKRRMAELRAARGAKDSSTMWELESAEPEKSLDADPVTLRLYTSGKLGKWDKSVFDDEFFEL